MPFSTVGLFEAPMYHSKCQLDGPLLLRSQPVRVRVYEFVRLCRSWSSHCVTV